MCFQTHSLPFCTNWKCFFFLNFFFYYFVNDGLQKDIEANNLSHMKQTHHFHYVTNLAFSGGVKCPHLGLFWVLKKEHRIFTYLSLWMDFTRWCTQNINSSVEKYAVLLWRLEDWHAPFSVVYSVPKTRRVHDGELQFDTFLLNVHCVFGDFYCLSDSL